MKKPLLLALLFAAFGSAPAYAGYYISGSVGAGMPGDVEYVAPIPGGYDLFQKFDTGCTFNGAVGYNFGTSRVEAAVGYQQNGFKNGVYSDGTVINNSWNPILKQYVSDFNLSVLTVMANEYFDLTTASGIKPYFMAGAGLESFDSGDGWIDKTCFALQLGAGIGVKIARNTTFDLGYRYIRPVGMKDQDNWQVNWETHNIQAGVRYEF
ncbi:MAG: porin family protein [Chlorobiaceae bacterium]|nr:porin family protein [Chlorobiaceae bacterium]